jgi:hypothetical protein
VNDTLLGAVAALHHTGAQLEDASAALRALDPGAGMFGDGPGRLGELGQDLHRRWQQCLDARAREAQAQAARLAELADAVRRAGAGYAETDANAQRRHPEVQ